jgi:hypothetical protein
MLLWAVATGHRRSGLSNRPIECDKQAGLAAEHALDEPGVGRGRVRSTCAATTDLATTDLASSTSSRYSVDGGAGRRRSKPTKIPRVASTRTIVIIWPKVVTFSHTEKPAAVHSRTSANIATRSRRDEVCKGWSSFRAALPGNTGFQSFIRYPGYKHRLLGSRPSACRLAGPGCDRDPR